MNRFIELAVLSAVVCFLAAISGCSTNEAKIEEIARRVSHQEALNVLDQYKKSFVPEKFSFGGALEKEWSHAQGVRAGNLIFVSGQQPYDTNLNEKGMPKTDLETGRTFEQQLDTALGNIQKVLANYNATMDDVTFLQIFVDEKAGKNKAEFNNAPPVISKYFPKGLQAMTVISVDNLYGPEQLVETNAIAVVSR
jgi:enamine deaminase RidA (YjgF/YER057c/UK114 family)